ncbi:MAG: serine protease Do [Lentisphaeria bacterium]|jgi:serine protease Do
MFRSILNAFLLFVLLSSAAVNAAVKGLPDFSGLIERASPAVVKINTVSKISGGGFRLPPGQQIPDIFKRFLEPRGMPERDMHSMGSGFFISSDGYLLTNNHVIDNADEIVVRLIDRREFDAIVIGVDPLSDLALLKVEEKGLPYLKMADSKVLKVGEWVVAIGSPFGLDFSASAGIVSAKGRSIPNGSNGNYVPFIQTDVAINPGNSGGPLFNLDGDVVGVNSQIYTRSGGSIGLSFAIPSSVAKNVVAQLKKKGKVDRGWLGVVIQEVDKNLADSFCLDVPMGALISSMEPAGPAEKSGLKVGDVIIKFDSGDIFESADLPHVVGVTTPGVSVPVEIIRQCKKKVLTVKVGTKGGVKSEVAVSDGSPSGSVGGRLGVVVESVDRSLLEKMQLKGGVMVKEVNSSGAAAKAGVAIGDVIAQLGFEELMDVDDFNKVVESLPKNTILPIRFFSNGQPVFRTFTLEE